MSESSDKPDAVMCVLSYFGIFAMIPLLTKKDDPFIQWHAKQGLLFLVAMIVVMIALVVLGIVLAMVVPALAVIAAILNLIVSLGWLALTIICILKALKGEKFEIPVISGFINKVPDVG